MKIILKRIMIACVLLGLISCSVNWKTPSGYAEVSRTSNELSIFNAEGLMIRAHLKDNEVPGGERSDLDFWSGNMLRSLQSRGYYQVETKLEKASESSSALWWSSWILQDNGKSKRYIVGLKTEGDVLLVLEASAIDTVLMKHQAAVMKFFNETQIK